MLDSRTRATCLPMTDTASTSIREQAASGERSHEAMISKIAWAVLILITLYVCYFSHLGAFGLVGPDEPRYAWIARDMAETGDWVTPRLYGKPWFEKPVPLLLERGIEFQDCLASAKQPRDCLALCSRFLPRWRWPGWRFRNGRGRKSLARWLVTADAEHRGDDWLHACGIAGHAVQRDADAGDGLRGCDRQGVVASFECTATPVCFFLVFFLAPRLWPKARRR